MLAMAMGSFATFAIMYCVQPILPALSRDFGIDAGKTSLAVSATLLSTAAGMLLTGLLSDIVSKRGMMIAGLLAAAILTTASLFVEKWIHLLVLRTLTGLALSTFPALSIAYLTREIDGRFLGGAVAAVISANSIGGIAGRISATLLEEAGGWRMAIGAVGLVCFACSLGFALLLPAETRTTTPRLSIGQSFQAYWTALKNPAQRAVFAMGFLMLGCFVSVYNYISFRLLAPPFGIAPAYVSLLFFLYGFGIVGASTVTFVEGRLGTRRALRLCLVLMALGMLLTFAESLLAIFAGIAVMTAGFFAAHAIANTFIGLSGGRGQAASVYMVAYYVGGSAIGTVSGWAWTALHWTGVATTVLFAVALCGALSALLPKQR